MHIRFLVRVQSAASLLSVASLVLCGACHVDGKVNASVNANEPIPARSDDEAAATSATSTPTTTPAPAPATPAPVAAVAPAPSAPPADACPLVCHAARGSEKATLTNEEVAQLRTALEPVLGRMRTCSSPDEWRRHGSPFVNLRIDSDGSLSELGVEPNGEGQSSCFDDAARGASVSVSLPGRKVVRCAERCARETPAAGARRGRRAR